MLKAADIMTQAVGLIRGSATVAEATQLMRDQNWRALIVDRRNEQDVYGIITSTDIIRKVVVALGKDPRSLHVYQIMTKPCIVINPDLGINYLTRPFATHELHIAPVIQHKLLGIISESDILNKSDFLETSTQTILEAELASTIEQAYAICERDGATAKRCLNAWKIVDSIETEVAFQRAEGLDQTAFEKFCENYPEALDVKMYETWCSG